VTFNEKIADRIREIISLTHKNVEEKKMFAGLCFMVNDKMCVGVHEDKIMVRLDPKIFDTIVEKEGCTPMNFTGKVMKGFIFVSEDVLKTNRQLEYWMKLALEFNKIAKSSKKTAGPKAGKK
jgi:TfoX/Sxy family transcriptional regulator of competence genes